MNIKFLSIKETAEMLCVPVQTVYSWIRKGKEPKPYKFNGQYKFALEDIKAFIKKSKEN